jgi:ABC-type phosphate transport system substrate-binding protein
MDGDGVLSMRTVFAGFGRRKALHCLVLLIGFALITSPLSWAGGDLVIIVNKSNKTNSLSRDEVKNIFLGKRSVWTFGGNILTCDLVEGDAGEGDSARAVFAENFLHKDLHVLKSYWIKMIFSGRSRPPVTKKSAAEVKKFVSIHKDAIGYIYRQDLDDSVRELPVVFSD